MGGKTPTGKITASQNHCASGDDRYGAGSGNVNGSPAIAISAILENNGMGNTGTNNMTGVQPNGATTDFSAISTYTKAYGSGYVIAR